MSSESRSHQKTCEVNSLNSSWSWSSLNWLSSRVHIFCLPAMWIFMLCMCLIKTQKIRIVIGFLVEAQFVCPNLRLGWRLDNISCTINNENCCYKWFLTLCSELLNKQPTYSDPLISIIDPDVVSLPWDGGLRVASGWDTLHDSWLTSCHHHITGRLTEVISQNWRKEQRCREMVRISENLFADDTIFYRALDICSSADIQLTFCLQLILYFTWLCIRVILTLYWHLVLKETWMVQTKYHDHLLLCENNTKREGTLTL